MPTRELDWAGASVEGGELTVPLSGEPDKAWRARAEAVLVQLQRAGGAGSEANAIEVKRDGVVVAHVADGTEDQIRHLLESVVLQANAPDEESEEDADGPEDEAAAADARLTSAFQAFGDEGEPAPS